MTSAEVSRNSFAYSNLHTKSIVTSWIDWHSTKLKITPKNNPTPRYKGQFLQFGWGDKKYFYTKMIPKHYFTMDEKCAEIGWAVREISNNLSRGRLPPKVSYTKISNGRIDTKIGWNVNLILLYIYTKFQPCKYYETP